MASSPSPFRRDAILADRYLVLERLGSGSVGTVYLALDRAADQRVALKVIRSDRLSPRAVSGLQAEFRAFAALRHPQIARVHDFGYLEGGRLPFYTREYVAGSPLAPGPPGDGPPSEALAPFLDLLEALEYLHVHGMLHLDVHAGNVIAADDPARGAVLIDFGLLPVLERTPSPGAGSLLAGPPPEVVRGDVPGPASDLWLVGRLLMYRLTGLSDPETRLPPEIPGWGPRLTAEIERIVARCLVPSPNGRFRSATELRDAIARALGGTGARSPAPSSIERTCGRRAELDAIDARIRGLQRGETSVLWLHGPPGSGKSRLLWEARVRAQIRGLRVAEVRYLPESVPGTDPARELAASGLPRASFEWLDALDPEHGGTPEDRARRAARAYFTDDGCPLVVLVDDIDAADPGKRGIVDALVAECLSRTDAGPEPRPLLLVVTSAEAAPSAVGRARAARRLAPLGRSDATELLIGLLGALRVPPDVLRSALSRAGGSPLRLRRLGRFLLSEFGTSGAVPAGTRIPDGAAGDPGAALPPWAPREPVARDVLVALAAIRRPATRDEIAAASGRAPAAVASGIRRLAEADAVTAVRRGRTRHWTLPGVAEAREIEGWTTPSETRAIHARLARRLLSARERDPAGRARLARHLLGAGRLAEGRRVALEAARALREAGDLDQALGLLSDVASGIGDLDERFQVDALRSAILQETGDHRRGVEILEPYHRYDRLPEVDRVRLRRLLGTHCHRAGEADRALRIFEEARRLADPVRDLEDLLFIDSELAEIHTYRGEYDRAEAICLRGLEHIERVSEDRKLVLRMELRSSLGHLELRRMNLRRARRELRAALVLAGKVGSPAALAPILNNLGIVERQLHRFGAARRCFRRAERLLARAREVRAVVAIACNLAVIAAQLGRSDEARRELDRAARLLRRHPGDRLEFFVEYTRGVVAHALGDAGGAIDALERALAEGRRLGDLHLAAHGEVYLAEAKILCGRYREAAEALGRAIRSARELRSPLLARMAHARAIVLHALLGDGSGLARSRRALAAVPATDADLPEAWIALLEAFGALLEGGDDAGFRRSIERFQSIGVPAGERLARAGILAAALRRGDRRAIASWVRASPAPEEPPHAFAAVLEPVLLAEAALDLGEDDRAEEWLARAGTAMVGQPFLELEGRVDLLRARLALRRDDRIGARGAILRGVHARRLLLELAPRRAARASFAKVPRFRALDEAALRAEGAAGPGTERLARTAAVEGLVGSSSPMVRLFRTIESLRGQDAPVLIRGETGTGKDLVARALHRASPRSGGPFVAVHCASIPEALFETELFGHEAGAFTGAEVARPGLLETAAGGTLLLDDVHELPPSSQSKLLHALSSKAIRRVGATDQRPLDVRFLASSTVDLHERVAAGAFRPDLYYRLRIVEIELPPLRERHGDVALLAGHFLRRHAERLGRDPPVLEPGAVELLEAATWRGNVRELEATMLRALIQLPGLSRIGARDLEPLAPEPGAGGAFPEELVRGRRLEDLRRELDRAYLRSLWKRTSGDLGRMMDELEVRRTQLYEMLRKAGLSLRDLRGGG